jgi:hypothetical protein
MKSSLFLTTAFAALAGQGFVRKSLLWCRSTVETIFAFELQRSRYSDQYFANVGIAFRRLDQNLEHPAPHRCHFYGRFGTAPVESALDFSSERSADEGERKAVLKTFEIEELIPASEQCSTEAGAIAFWKAGLLRVPLVLPAARSLLGLS